MFSRDVLSQIVLRQGVLNRLVVWVLCCAAVVSVLAWPASSESFAQRSKAPLVCKKSVLAALKPVPQLSYQCD
jgi:hypothetical protein